MKVIDIAQNLMRFRTETGNIPEIEKCLEYAKSLFNGLDVKGGIYHFDNASPVLFLANEETDNYDVVCLGHLDVVPATDDMFSPYIKDGKLYGRGSLDMKSFAAVALNSLEHVLKNKLPLKFAVILSTDEEKGSKSTHAFMEAHPNLKAKIVLDNDVGGDINKIVSKCKNPVFVKVMADGQAAHGSTPWEGIDANEILMETLHNIRQIYPYYSKGGVNPQNKWIDTVHVAIMNGGEVSNVIARHAEAVLDFRLTENSTVENLKRNLDKCMAQGATYKISSESTPVVMDENSPFILDYKHFAEQALGHPLEFEHIGGATDSRAFAVRGSIVIMHSGTGEGMHAEGEYVEVDSVEKIADTQIKFLNKLAQDLK